MLFSPFVIELLRERSGCPLRVSADCEQLALDIASATNEHIGVNTLKRLLGFIADERSPRTSTLDVIARYLGYEHWDALRIYDEQTENSAFDDRDEYLTCFFKPGQMVYVSYLPNRTVEMEYLGNSRFRVLSRENSKLMVGDELTPPETKGYTVSLLSVYLWALEAAKAKGKLSDSDYETKIKECESFIANFDTVMKESEDWYDTNKTTIVNSDRIYILGYGVDYGSALEAQLKIGEMLRVPSISYEIVEYSHGPTMALNKKQSIFMIGSDEAEFKQMLKFNKAFKNYSDRVHIITCKDLAESDGRDLVFSVKADKYLAPIMYTVPFQFVAAKGAKDIGIDTAINPFEIPLAHYQE